MRIGVVVDSGCDLPKPFLDENRISILPIAVRMDQQTLVDRRDPDATLAFYRDHLGTSGHDAETAPLEPEEIRDLFLGQLVLEYDYIFCLTIASSRSPIYENAMRASLGILNGYKPIRQKAGITLPFTLRVIDSKNLFSGQGITAVEAVRMIKAKEAPPKIRDRLEFLSRNTYMYGVPNDLFFLRARAQKKGDRSVSWFTAAVGTALDIKPVIRCHHGETAPVAKVRHWEQGVDKLFQFVSKRVVAGLLTPTVCISYGGALEEVEALPGYRELRNLCEARDVELFLSNMSMTGGINVGEGALTIAYAAEPHDPEL